MTRLSCFRKSFLNKLFRINGGWGWRGERPLARPDGRADHGFQPPRRLVGFQTRRRLRQPFATRLANHPPAGVRHRRGYRFPEQTLRANAASILHG
jgi:hypothetical protein